MNCTVSPENFNVELLTFSTSECDCIGEKGEWGHRGRTVTQYDW